MKQRITSNICTLLRSFVTHSITGKVKTMIRLRNKVPRKLLKSHFSYKVHKVFSTIIIMIIKHRIAFSESTEVSFIPIAWVTAMFMTIMR